MSTIDLIAGTSGVRERRTTMDTEKIYRHASSPYRSGNRLLSRWPACSAVAVAPLDRLHDALHVVQVLGSRGVGVGHAELDVAVRDRHVGHAIGVVTDHAADHAASRGGVLHTTTVACWIRPNREVHLPGV